MKSLFFLVIIFWSFFVRAECQIKYIQAEINDIESSSYWKMQKKKLIEKLAANYPRECKNVINAKWPGLKIVSEDYELVGAPENRMFEESWNFNHCETNERGLSFKSNTSGFLKNSIQIKVKTEYGSISTIANTCSPKAALASAIAVSDLVLSKKCPPIEIGGAKEADIAIQTTVHNIMDGQFGKNEHPTPAVR